MMDSNNNKDRSNRKNTPVSDVNDETAVKNQSHSSDHTRLPQNRGVPSSAVPPDQTRTGVKPGSTGRATGQQAAHAPDRTRLKNHSAADPGIRQRGQIEAQASQNHANREDATRFSPDRRAHGVSPNKTRIKPQKTAPASVNTPAGAQTQVLKERFLLEKVLGVGGMGVVYKAKDRLKVEAQDRDPYVAIKVLSEEFKAHPEAFIALQRESRKAQRIAHPNTVKVYDFDRDGDIVFMTMEYMVGKPLDQMIKQYRATGLPREDAWEILKGMCSALIHAHNENIVHSDFKPGNIFVTENGMAKIFDFGIARAVANIDRQTGKSLDRTVFDAGSLGALTPAYASLEMLLGKTPDPRDDIYALGCIAYEILTGDHPFNRLPADEAYNKNLKPKRINDIDKQQWRAIESALAFKRENRIESVEEFYRQISSKKRPKFMLIASVLLLVSVSAFAYVRYFDQKNITPPDQSEIRSELEFEIRYKLYKENIENLLANPVFTNDWETALWKEVSGMSSLFPDEPDAWMLSTRTNIYRMYIARIHTAMDESKFTLAKTLIENAYRYTDNPKLLDNEKIRLAEALKIQQEKNRRLAESSQSTHKSGSGDEDSKKNRTNLFNVALQNVNSQLQCTARLNMRNFKIAVTKLRSLDYNRYTKLEDNLAGRLAKCITEIGKRYPEHALDSKRYAMNIFRNNPAIMAISIKERDACDLSIAGLGARGDRAVCRDKLQGGGAGPAMVVIPGNGTMKPFAIGKYEVSIGEFSLFCKQTKKCSSRVTGKEHLPITNINVSLASEYLRWLSGKTRKKYRLPTKREWIYAAKSRSNALDPNRNCVLNSRGIEKGGQLVRTNTGKQNGWGLINYAGNAQEWVYTAGRKLAAVGGSYESAMDSCTADTLASHSGNADSYTGFRVVRDLVEN